ncbi:MAG: hypothetical protein LBK25_01885 [Treponema sp.]|jgi:hypothetical protein|nr:hypothetical protein [Treponema sp.]
MKTLKKRLIQVAALLVYATAAILTACDSGGNGDKGDARTGSVKITNKMSEAIYQVIITGKTKGGKICLI